MPQLNATNVDAVLSNVSVAYMLDQSQYIANKVFPIVPVEKMSGIFMKYDRGDWLRDEAEKRADATESVGSGYNVGRDTYQCDVYAFHKDVGDQIVANSINAFNPIADATRFVASRLLLKQEKDFANTFFKTGVWATDWSGVSTAENGTTTYRQFSDYANSDPVQVIENAKEKIASTTGYEANTMVMGRQVFAALKNHPEIIDRIKYVSDEVPTEQLIARLFGVDRLFVARSLINTAKEGQAETLAYNYGKSILLTHSAPNPGLLTASAGYTFSWDGVSDGAGLSIGTTSMRLDTLRATRIESQSAWSNKVIAADLGLFINNIIA